MDDINKITKTEKIENILFSLQLFCVAVNVFCAIWQINAITSAIIALSFIITAALAFMQFSMAEYSGIDRNSESSNSIFYHLFKTSVSIGKFIKISTNIDKTTFATYGSKIFKLRQYLQKACLLNHLRINNIS